MRRWEIGKNNICAKSVQRRPAAKLVPAQLCFLLSAGLQSETAQQFFAQILLRPSHPLSDLKRSKWNGHPIISPSQILWVLWPRIVLMTLKITNYHVLTWLTLFQKKRDRMSILASIYQNVFKRSSTFVVAVAFGAIGVCRAFPLHFLSFKVFFSQVLTLACFLFSVWTWIWRLCRLLVGN